MNFHIFDLFTARNTLSPSVTLQQRSPVAISAIREHFQFEPGSYEYEAVQRLPLTSVRLDNYHRILDLPDKIIASLPEAPLEVVHLLRKCGDQVNLIGRNHILFQPLYQLCFLLSGGQPHKVIHVGNLSYLALYREEECAQTEPTRSSQRARGGPTTSSGHE